ncbi:MAG: hypothetical protein ACKV2O_10950 [Acidimicrobiales bacterium]
MNAVGYVIAGYAVTATALALYVGRMFSRARRVVVRVPQDRRRWM